MIAKRVIAAVAILAWVAPAAAEPRKVMVLPADGRVDAKLRAKVSAAILRLARTLPDQVSAGEVSFNDLAAAVGCMPAEASCKDDVITTLAVDEIVIGTVTARPGGVEVNVRRASAGSAPREASTFVPLDRADRLDALAPLFGARTAGPAPAPAPPVTPIGPPPRPVGPPAPEPAPAITTSPPPAAAEPPPRATPAPEPEPATAPAPASAGSAEPALPAPPPAEGRDRRRRLRIAGMATGGTMLAVGVLLWGQADSIQRDIDTAPTGSRSDLLALRDLEAKGDRYAAWGNVLTVGGVVLAGVSTYFFLKGRRSRRPAHAQLAPALFDHGAGIALTIGGPP